MLRVALLSDNHAYIDDAMVRHLQKADEIWHAGDIGSVELFDRLAELKPLRAVYGNIDGGIIRKALPEKLIFTVEGLKVYMIHIGGYPGRFDKRVTADIKTSPPDLFISGHSHILKIMKDQTGTMLHMNPGAAGKSGFHLIRTMIMFDIDNGKIENVNVIELGKK